MKGIFKFGSVALSAAMVAGLGIASATPVFAADSDKTNTGNASSEGEETTTATKYIELYDKDNNLLAGTNPDEESYYSLNTKKTNTPNGTKTKTEIDLFLPVGGTKTLTANLDQDATAQVVWAYKDVATSKGKIGDTDNSSKTIVGDSVINKYDVVTPDGSYDDNATTRANRNAEVDVVALDNGTLTAKAVGDAVVYAYASDAVIANKDTSNPETVVDTDENVITIRVHVFNETVSDLKFEGRDTVYDENQVRNTGDETTTTSVEVDDIVKNGKDGLDLLADIDAALAKKTNTPTHLKYHGSQYVSHLGLGESGELIATTTLNNTDLNTPRMGWYYENAKSDGTDYGDVVADGVAEADFLKRNDADTEGAVKFVNGESRYLTVNGSTVTVTGSAPSKGYGNIYAYVDADLDGIQDKNETSSNSVIVMSHKGVAVYRVYNPNNFEHLYTTDEAEKNNLVSLGWQDEKIGWFAPTTGDEVVRMYNPNNGGEHVYTTDANEVANLEKAGWQNEGTKFYSASVRYYPIYREYNPNEIANNHNYTASSTEDMFLGSLGWKREGTKLYAVEIPWSVLSELDSADNDSTTNDTVD